MEPQTISRTRRTLVWSLLSAGIILLAFFSMGLGRFSLSWGEMARVMAHLPDPGLWTGPDAAKARVMLLIRAPRVLTALLIGAGMGISGAALQGLFRNPLASPDVAGVTSGAALGGVAGIMFFGSAGMTVLSAFLAGVGSLALVFWLSRSEGKSSVLMLVLAGMVCGAFFSAMISLAKFVADPLDTLPGIVFWLMGSLSSATWNRLGTIAAPIMLASMVLFFLRFQINILSLGDEEAETLGVKVERIRWLTLLCIALITASVVSACGVVGWVGLIVPHGARLLTGPDHRALLPTSALAGALFVLAVDDVARAATAAEIPLGILTAAVGAPVFVYLLRRFRKEQAIR